MTRNGFYGDDDEAIGAGDDAYEECEVCHQEFTGICPIGSADCPYADMTEDDEDEGPDFEDVDDLDELIEDDEEIEKLIDEDVEIPEEDLIDDDLEPEASDDEEVGEVEPEPEPEPVKATKGHAAKLKRGPAKKASREKRKK
ncbi:MAG TPA: hypothetical protein PKE55_12375 [Kiritimatiellia bacterium]|nr:hypothetical protein [Kiritimatiellia bacterium]